MKRILTITFLNYFVSGGLTLIIPLLLLERNVNLAEIGLIISILPIVFLAVRMLFAVLADQFGWAPFYVLLNWPGTLLATTIYFLANSIPFFAFGKIVEAVKESSYWAVIRTSIFSLSPKRKAKESTKNLAIISLGSAAGSAISGLGIAYMGFSFALGVMIITSTIIGIPAALLWKTNKRDARQKTLHAVASLDPRGRSKTFWLVSFNLLMFSFAQYPLMNLLVPVFMAEELRYDYALIGIAFMLYNVVSSSVTLSTLNSPLGVGRVVLLSAIAVSTTFLLANSGSYFLVPFLILAFARGLGWGFLEAVIAKASKDSVNVSIDIGLLNIPVRFAEFTSVLFAGFAAESIGYMPIFAASGIIFTAFSVLSLYILRKRVIP